jgi:hypothetical protein
MNRAMIVNTVISAVGGALIGGGVTYVVVKKKVEARANKDIADVKEHYKLLRKEDGTLGFLGQVDRTAEQTYAMAQDVVRNYELVNDLAYAGTVEELEVSGEQASVQVRLENLQNEGAEDDGYEPTRYPNSINMFEQFSKYERIEGEPFLITRQEFEDNDSTWETDSVTYYEGDDTLVEDLTSDVVPDVERAIGRRHLHMFGQPDSEDSNIIYIQNDAIRTRYEVSRHEGHYSVVVLGLDPEEVGLKEPKQRPLRMRAND